MPMFDAKPSQKQAIAFSTEPSTIEIELVIGGMGRARHEHEGLLVMSGGLASDQAG
jgi:hypothetical protein